jgi:hypothetical protein
MGAGRIFGSSAICSRRKRRGGAHGATRISCGAAADWSRPFNGRNEIQERSGPKSISSSVPAAVGGEETPSFDGDPFCLL